jgi:NIPSNAP
MLDGGGKTLKRRQFLASTFAASALALAERTHAAPAGESEGKPRQYYELRTYQMRSGVQSQITAKYVAQALIPALNRMGIEPVGAFNLNLGPDTPSLYLLLPSADLGTLANAELRLRQDEQFLAAAAPFWNAPESSPAFERLESTLLIALPGWPQLVLPPPTAHKAQRIFQLRTYQSASNRDHLVKMKMFESGEFEVFQRSGFWPVFFGDALIGPRLPRVTYMVSFKDLDELNGLWKTFFNDPQWKKLTAMPEFNFEPTVSSVSNLVLTPAPYSQV